MLDPVVRLAEMLRRAGVDVSTGDVIDAGRALEEIELEQRDVVRIALRSVMVKRESDLAAFDRAFDLVFRASGLPPAEPLDAADARPPPSRFDTDPSALAAAVASAATEGDADEMQQLAARAVAMFAVDDASDRQLIHRILRALDIANMMSAAMRQLRGEDDLSEFELSLRRHEIAHALEAFRRALALEVARRRESVEGFDDVAVLPPGAADKPLLSLSSVELAELRRTLQPLVRQLAARIGSRRRARPTGRLDVRRTIRRSLQSGGIPIDPALRRRHPHRPDVVVLCDISGSVAEFAQFTFTLVHAIHDVLAGVRSFAFVGGVSEMTEVFATATYDVPVQRILERRGVVGLDGHSDYGAVFRQFAAEHLDAVGPRTTLVVTGDARSNFRDPGVAAFRTISERARRVYWLDPEPEADWELDDSALADYRPLCDAVFCVSSVRSLADVIASIV